MLCVTQSAYSAESSEYVEAVFYPASTIMSEYTMEELAQAFVDVLAWFLVPFATILAVSWVCSLFRR